MANVTEAPLARLKETEGRRQNLEMRQLRAEHQKQYTKEVQTNENSLKRMREEYSSKQKMLEAETEQKLAQLRRTQKVTLVDEKKKLNEEMEEMKTIHASQVSGIRNSQNHEVERLQDSHKRTLELAREKFMREKLKWETA